MASEVDPTIEAILSSDDPLSVLESELGLEDFYV